MVIDETENLGDGEVEKSRGQRTVGDISNLRRLFKTPGK